jgi:glycosyltransferase involved in cell wall biosynthesis
MVALRAAGLRYVVVCHAAVETDWPHDGFYPQLRAAFTAAEKCYFVSRANLELTEMQLGQRLTNAEVVWNPLGVPYNISCPWPVPTDVWRLACVARLEPASKGQDVLFRTLALPKWRERTVRASLFGGGANAEQLARLAEMLELKSVVFKGQTGDIVSVWREHHALVLPSRCEGLPLSVVEAMLCGRPCIVSDVAGNPEVVEDNETGFVAAAPSVRALDEAMERAWQRRAEGSAMGQRAAIRIRQLVPPDPAKSFAARLWQIATRDKNVPATLQDGQAESR